MKTRATGEGALTAALALAAAASGFQAALQRQPTEADGWLARTYAGFPEQLAGRRFAIRGTHLTRTRRPRPHRPGARRGRGVRLRRARLDAGLPAALESVAHRRPRRILDLGTGSGILAMAAAKLLRRRVLATDIDPWSVRVGGANAALERHRAHAAVPARRWLAFAGDRTRRPYDLVFANILARPLCLMARHLAAHLAPGGTAILAGLLDRQVRMVLAAHRRAGPGA